MSHHRTLSAWAAVAVLALTACAGAGASAQPIGPQADLDFAVATVDGRQFDGTSLVGQPAVLWFWAPWCPTCVAEAPAVLDIAERHPDQLSVIGVAGLGEVPQMLEFVELTRTGGLTHLADGQGEVWRLFGVRAQSTYVLLDGSGSIVFSGFLGNDELRARVDGLVG